METEIAIIGGGIAGLSIAAWLAPHTDVTLLEAEDTLGYHTTGRSAALYTECHGAGPLRLLAKASREYLVSGEHLSTSRPVMFVSPPGCEERLTDLLGRFSPLVPNLERLSPAQVSETCGAFAVDGTAGGVLEPDSLDLDVDGIQTSYTKTIRANRGIILTKARVQTIAHTRNLWQIVAGEHHVSARIVVNAAGAWGDRVAVMAGVAPLGLTPKLRSVFIFTTTHTTNRWPFVVDADEQWYFKPEGPNLLGSAASELPSEPLDARAPEIDIALGIQRVTEHTNLSIRSPRTTWAGLRTFTKDRVPAVGFDPDAPNFFWLVGQGGDGIMTSPALGELAASLVLSEGIPQRIGAFGVTGAALAPDRFRP